MQGALHISVCLQYPAAARSHQHPVDTLVSPPPDGITATPSTWRGMANSIYCKRHQMVTLCSSSALHRAIRMLGLSWKALYGFNYKQFFSLCLTLAIGISGDSYNGIFSVKQIIPKTVSAPKTHQEQAAFLRLC